MACGKGKRPEKMHVHHFMSKKMQYSLRWCRAARLCDLFVHGLSGHSFWHQALAVSAVSDMETCHEAVRCSSLLGTVILSKSGDEGRVMRLLVAFSRRCCVMCICRAPDFPHATPTRCSETRAIAMALIAINTLCIVDFIKQDN